MAVSAQKKKTLSVSGSHSVFNIEGFSFFSDLGDGGNDVSMIQAADCGIGIEGKVMSLCELQKQCLGVARVVTLAMLRLPSKFGSSSQSRFKLDGFSAF